MDPEPWSVLRSWQILRNGGQETLTAAPAQRHSIARLLDLEALEFLLAEIEFEPWRDGARIWGRVRGETTRRCGVTLEPLTESVDTELELRFVVEDSTRAATSETELVVDLEADDPPEVASLVGVDVGRYVVEALSLALDPFPRAPGAVFEFSDPVRETSPFDVIAFGKKTREI